MELLGCALVLCWRFLEETTRRRTAEFFGPGNKQEKQRQEKEKGVPRRKEGKMSRRITFLGVVRFTDRVLVAGYSPSEADDALIIKEARTCLLG